MKHLKQEFDKLTFKDVLLYSIGLLTLAAAFVLLFMGMMIPPEGEIHDSVLTAFGISLLFAAAIYGISAYFVDNLSTFKKSIMELLAHHEINMDAIKENIKMEKEEHGDVEKRE